jgi:hypothetical protein
MTDRVDPKNYHLEWIACKNLSVVWIQAQRKYNEKAAKNIADNFDPDLFDPIKVTLPNGNGHYHICDGQTRKGAIEMLYGQEEKVPCFVAREGDPVKAAKLFLGTNTGRRPPSAIDNFKVSVTAEMKNEVAINRIVRQHGYRVDTPGPDAISAVSALKYGYTCGVKVLDQTLRTVKKTWNGDANAVNGNLLRGFASFLNEFSSQVDEGRFCESVSKKWTPGQMLQEAKSLRDMRGGSTQATIKLMLFENYNRRNPGKKIKPKTAE